MLAFIDGTIKEAELKELWCVFAYLENEDKNEIVNRSPLVYNSYKHYKYESQTDNFKQTMLDWEFRGLQIVIRPVEMIVI